MALIELGVSAEGWPAGPLHFLLRDQGKETVSTGP